MARPMFCFYKDIIHPPSFVEILWNSDWGIRKYVDDKLQGEIRITVIPTKKWDGNGNWGWGRVNIKGLTSPFKKQ